jgi:hypothetical protein
MKYVFSLFILLSAVIGSKAQQLTNREVNLEPIIPFTEINFSTLPDNWLFTIEFQTNKAFPEPKGYSKELKSSIDKQRMLHLMNQAKNKTNNTNTVTAPSIDKVFTGNGSNGTPNDNSVAISNGGKIVSVVNTNVRMYDETGTSINPYKSLSAITTNQLGALNRTYDPRIIYDPLADRFIMVFLQGDSSNDSRIVIGFSQSNDPTLSWKFYSLAGNRWGNGTWFDYPIVCISKKDLFVTGNLLQDGKSWREGFKQSIIWQVKKQDGFDGLSLSSKYYDSITYNGRPIWSICAVQGGSQPWGPETYFISLRPGDASNDTVFLHTISNTLESGTATLGTRILKSNKPYGLPPSAIQPSGQYLQTNDARALSSIIEGGIIYFVGNTIEPVNFSPSVYLGKITGLYASPQVTAQYISYDTLDIGYPSLAYIGGGGADKSLLITFSHVSQQRQPGTSAVYIDRYGVIYSYIRIREGDGSINLLADSMERWGDYTGIQRKYNELGVVWISGSYGNTISQHPTTIAKIKANDTQLSTGGLTLSELKVFPNPATQFIYLTMQVESPGLYTFSITDMNGHEIKKLQEMKLPYGSYKVSLEISQLSAGSYILKAVTNHDEGISQKFVVGH